VGLWVREVDAIEGETRGEVLCNFSSHSGMNVLNTTEQ